MSDQNSEQTTETTANESGGATQPAQTGVVFTPEQQAHIDQIMSKVRKEGREAAKKELDGQQQKAKEEAEAARLKEQQEWQKLAETHEAKAKELTPQIETLTARVTEYETVITELLEAKVKALGDTAKNAIAALPGAPDVLARLKWLNANEGLFKTQQAPIGTQTRRPITNNQQQQQPTDGQRPIVRF